MWAKEMVKGANLSMIKEVAALEICESRCAVLKKIGELQSS